jgi:hypothetical protein
VQVAAELAAFLFTRGHQPLAGSAKVKLGHRRADGGGRVRGRVREQPPVIRIE